MAEMPVTGFPPITSIRVKPIGLGGRVEVGVWVNHGFTGTLVMRAVEADELELALAGRGDAQPLRIALAALAGALDPEPGSGDLCRICRCEDPEFEEAHASGCAYAAALRLLRRGAGAERIHG